MGGGCEPCCNVSVTKIRTGAGELLARGRRLFGVRWSDGALVANGLTQARRFRDALPFFDRALALQPGNAEVLRQLAATTVGVSFRLFRVPKTLVVCRHFHPVSARAQRNSLARSYSKQPALG